MFTDIARPWAITPAGLRDVAAGLRWRRSASATDLTALDARIEAHTAPVAARLGRGSERSAGTIAVLPLRGVITPRVSYMSMLYGGGSTGLIDWLAEFKSLVADEDVVAIVLDVDSPGGSTSLVQEAADAIYAARGSKPIVAIANTLCASAALWLAAQADELAVTPSGYVGSVGAYMVHEDWSGWNEQAGIDPTYVYAAPYKTEGNPDEPLTDEARADWQATVDENYDAFVDALARGRGTSAEDVRENYGQGRVLSANASVAAGMVDRVATFDDVIAGLVSSARTSGPDARASRADAGLITIAAARELLGLTEPAPTPTPAPATPPAPEAVYTGDDDESDDDGDPSLDETLAPPAAPSWAGIAPRH